MKIDCSRPWKQNQDFVKGHSQSSALVQENTGIARAKMKSHLLTPKLYFHAISVVTEAPLWPPRKKEN